MTFKETLKKIWHFLWESNSIWSLLVDIILIFLIVKFLLLPGIGLILGTSLPLVIVESGSMTHEANFDNWYSIHGSWYQENNITKETISSWGFHNGMNKGDIIMVRGNKEKEYKVGDVIIFKVSQNSIPIIHRIIKVEEIEGQTYYSTKGDHNDGQLSYEQMISKNQVIGKAIFRIPWLGWIKLFFVELFR